MEKLENKIVMDVEIIQEPAIDSDVQLQILSASCPPFFRNRKLMCLYLLMIPGCLVPAITLGFDSAMLNGLQSVPEWDQYFDHPRGARLGLLTSILSMGALTGIPFVSMIGDSLGRRWGIFVGGLCMAIGGIIQGCAQTYAMFLVSRFIIGIGIVFANTYAPILIGELAHPSDRMTATSLYQTSWYIGSACAAWTTFGTFQIHNQLSWRIPSSLQVLPAVIQMLFVWFLPESPRWLLATGKSERAQAILNKYYGGPNDFTRLAFRNMERVIKQETMVNTPWSNLFSTPGNRRRILTIVLLGVFSQFSGNGLISYYLTRVLETIGVNDPKQQNTINGCLQIFNWMTAVMSAFLTKKLLRRTQFMLSTAGMLTIFAFQTLCAGFFNERHSIAAGTAVIPMLFLFYLCYNLAFNALVYSYPVEFLPYPIRAKGMSVLMLFGKGAALVNAYVSPIGLQAIGWKYYLVYVGWLVIEVIMVYLVFVETKGPTLEAVSALFDGKREVDTSPVCRCDEERC